jgi:predicted anti-sigma-YlaC factor YlaD
MKGLAFPRCREMAEMVTDYLEGDLPFFRRVTARLHLSLCSACTRYFDQMRRTIGLLRDAPAATLPTDREDVLIQSVRSGLPPA